MRLRKITALLAALLMAVSMIPLSVFAEMGGDFPWTEESEPLLIEQIWQRDGFIDGIWFPWIHGGTVGHNLTSNELMADYYQVITYDRRGYGNSTFPGSSEESGYLSPDIMTGEQYYYLKQFPQVS